MDEDERENFYEWGGSDSYFMVDDVFQKLSLNSFIIILYSCIEIGMNTLCKGRYSDKRTEQKKKNNQAEDEGREPEFTKLFGIEYNDMTGKGIKRAKGYLEKVFYVNFDPVKEQWDEIIGLAKIRNAIVHDDGIAKEKIENDGKLKQHIIDGRLEITGKRELTGKNGKKKVVYGRVVIKREYLDAIVPIAKEFFKNLEM